MTQITDKEIDTQIEIYYYIIYTISEWEREREGERETETYSPKMLRFYKKELKKKGAEK